jgi:hypothetical protein
MRSQTRILDRLRLGILLISLFSAQGFERTWATMYGPLPKTVTSPVESIP